MIPRISNRSVLILIIALLFAGATPAARATGTTWTVNRPGDDVDNGDLAAHGGSIRFVLAHAVSGDLVLFGDFDADAIWLSSQAGGLVVPPGVAVGGRRDEADCGSYNGPLITIQDPSISPTGAIDTMISLGAGSTLRGVGIMRGRVSARISGPNVEICGVGLGRSVDGDGFVMLGGAPWSSALIVDGDHAVVRRSYLNGGVVMTTHASEARLGDTLDGSGDDNAGVRDAYVTVLADDAMAAQRVTIRDPFPRALHGMPGNGVSGGDDAVNHANNWAMTPEIINAYTYDSFATAEIHGIANPNSLVDIFFDNQITVTRQAPVRADATGVFTFTGALPSEAPPVLAIAASTLDDPAHPGRMGSSSQWSQPATVIVGGEPLLAATGRVIDLSGPAAGPAHPGDLLRFTVMLTNTGSVNVANIASSVFQASTSVTIRVGSGKMLGQGIGFVATDLGFSGGMLAPGQVATYQLDATVKPTSVATLARYSLEVGGSGIVAIPVSGFMPIAPAGSAPTPRAWLALVIRS